MRASEQVSFIPEDSVNGRTPTIMDDARMPELFILWQY